MNKPLLASIVTAVLLLASGCAGSDADAHADAPAVPVPAETPREPVALPTEAPAEAAEAEETAEVSAEDDRFGPKEMNDRGNLVKAIGQLAGLSNEAGESVVEFTVTNIEPGFECTSDYADPAENGQFIAISLDVLTTPLLAEEDWPEFYLSAHDFRVFAPDGTRENDSVGIGFMCTDAADTLPAPMGPGERAAGKIVLDSAHTTGSIALNFGGAGWEWGY